MNPPIYKYLFEWELVTGPKMKVFAQTHSEALKRLDKLMQETNIASLKFNPIPGNTIYYNGYYFQGQKFVNTCHNNIRNFLVG